MSTFSVPLFFLIGASNLLLRRSGNSTCVCACACALLRGVCGWELGAESSGQEEGSVWPDPTACAAEVDDGTEDVLEEEASARAGKGFDPHSSGTTHDSRPFKMSCILLSR